MGLSKRMIAAVVCMLLLGHLTLGLEDQLPDTNGLFFGKRFSHPHQNNLLFGKRVDDYKISVLQQLCTNVQEICSVF